MSFIVKKNPYDQFKLNSNLNDSTKKIKKKMRAFSSKETNRSMLLNTILKSTKSILKSKTKFTGYMNEYRSIVAKSTFKRPDIQYYPLLRKENSAMIPIKSQKEEKQKNKKIFRCLLNKPIQSISFREKFKHQLNMAVSSENKKVNSTKNEKDKEKSLLFSDFFCKWNNNNNNMNESININSINNSQYSYLNYDENEIFYSDYTDYIKEKTTYLLRDKIENLQKKLKINFVDSRKKKIKLQLISMKLIFEPFHKDREKNYKKDYNFEDYKEINNCDDNCDDEENKEEDDVESNINNDNTNLKNIITLPLSYVFLFYINGMEFFKNILLASIKFNKDFTKIFFEEDEIYAALRKERSKKRVLLQKKRNVRYNDHKSSFKQQYSKIHLVKRNMSIKIKETPKIMEKPNDKNDGFSTNGLNIDDDDKKTLYQTQKNIVVIHSNPDLKKKEKYKNILSDKNAKEIKYTEYCFIWETPNITYKIRMIMPIIIFWSEHIKKNIVTYCEQKLFLFLLKKNFINWDYYILNYLFSIQIFRKFILKGLSFYSNNNISKSKLSLFNKFRTRNVIISKLKGTNTGNNSLFSYIDEKTIILNVNRKIYNNLNENNESYIFFYTDNSNHNSIIDLHSYHIFIEYDKLNSKNCWEFALNFKQMNYLSMIDKYENLETFLPKIIYTNFEDHTLSIDFSILENLNAKIFEYRKLKDKENCEIINKVNSVNFGRKKIINGMILSIIMPFIIVEQYDKNKLLSNNMQKIDLNSNLLKILQNCNNVYWSKKILNILKNKISNLLEHNKSSLNLLKNASNPLFNNDNKINNNEHDKNVMNYHKYKSSSKSFNFKKKKVHI